MHQAGFVAVEDGTTIRRWIGELNGIGLTPPHERGAAGFGVTGFVPLPFIGLFQMYQSIGCGAIPGKSYPTFRLMVVAVPSFSAVAVGATYRQSSSPMPSHSGIESFDGVVPVARLGSSDKRKSWKEMHRAEAPERRTGKHQSLARRIFSG